MSTASPTLGPASESVVRYPLRAVLAVAGAALLFLFEVLFGAFFCVIAIPLVPIFVGIILSGGGLLASALEYARRTARVDTRPGRLRAAQHEKVEGPAPAPRAA